LRQPLDIINDYETFNNPCLSELSFSGDSEHDLALNVPMGSSFVRLASIGKRKRAVDADTNRSGIEQATEFCKLRAVRAHLGCRDRDAQLLGLLGAGEA